MPTLTSSPPPMPTTGDPVWLHLVAALVAIAAAVLYLDRTAYLHRDRVLRGQRVEDVTVSFIATRIGLALLLGGLAGAFFDLHDMRSGFEVRHWAVFLPLVVITLGQVGMRVDRHRSRRRNLGS